MTSAELAKPDYDVLNVVALKKMATSTTIAEASGRPRSEIDDVLTGLSDRGLVVVAGAAALPTDEAEPALQASAAQLYADVRGDGDVTALVERFEEVNAQFLRTMSAWQQVDVGGRKVANDHTDSEYDGKIIDRLDRLVQRLAPLISALATHDARFAVYRERFDAAMAAVDGGRHDLVSSPTADSVHNVWFEFHEDLLRTLGRQRSE